MYGTLSVFCVLAALAQDRAQENQIPEAIALELRTLAARRAIVSGEVEFELVRTFDPAEPGQRYEWRATFDGERVRCDVIRRLAGSSGAADTPDASEVRRAAFTQNGFFRYSQRSRREGSTQVRYGFRSAKPCSPLIAVGKIDPCLIGVVAADPFVLHSASLESSLALPDRANTSVESKRLGGLETWRIQYDRGDGARVRMWIAPSQDYNVVRAIEELDYGCESVTHTIECENRKYGVPGIWFPHQVRYQRFVDGKRYYGVVLTVVKASFNQPVDEQVFTLAGMDIPRGTPIFDLPGPRECPLIWDGRRVVPASVSSPSPDLDAEGPAGRVPWRLLASPVALALAAVLALFVRRRQRFAKPRPGV
jgi:hypothetical protein